MDCNKEIELSDDIPKLEAIAREIRGKIMEISHSSGAMHVGSAFSCVDILVAAYWSALCIDPSRPDDPDRDRFILSKGHAALALFAALAFRGFFSMDILPTYGRAGSCLEEHPGPRCAPGVEAATGSLGHGLPIGLGMALAGRIGGRPYRVFTLLSDGECNEGSVWEAAMFAASQRLDRVLAIVDFNKWQATGRSCEVMALNPLVEKWKSFCWSVYEIDGHDMQALLDVFGRFPDGSGGPVAVVAHTVKGKGVSFMEDDNNWHYRVPSAEDVYLAKKELRLI
jgi:transketolase